MSPPDPPYVYQEFPTWLYHKHSTPIRRIERIVASAEEQAALGQDWAAPLAALKLHVASAVPGDIPLAHADNARVPAESLPFLQNHVAEIRAVVASTSSPLSAFYDEHGCELIGGPADPTACRQQKQRIEELVEPMVVAVGLVPLGSDARAGGLAALGTFALDRHYQCVQTLSDLPGCPVRVDRVCEVLEAWCRHLITLAAASMAAAQATRHMRPMPTKPTSDTDQAPKGPPTLASATWGDVEIWFLSPDAVQLRIIGKLGPQLNYAELGFEDHRTHKPAHGWVLLRALASAGGTLKDFHHPQRIAQHVRRIRKVLRAYFERQGLSIPGDPLPYVKRAGYQAQFKIGLRRSFHT